ncbi:hypothetical protein BXZ70DRAFT_356457 [Cristinia sonorae]|uniref:Uncharacterized protein n=1 Tax=Cristinia sonorae TaxID=1940300 RepID=A0A8K0UJP5_9AGAR|nr:hypothetical protein BXZ70DRAFT_356457 [Cristinia sonorae]
MCSFVARLGSAVTIVSLGCTTSSYPQSRTAPVIKDHPLPRRQFPMPSTRQHSYDETHDATSGCADVWHSRLHRLATNNTSH